MTELTTQLLQSCADDFRSARKNIIEGASKLYKIEQEELWKGNYSSFSEYVEGECQITKGYASKLTQAFEFYVIQGGVPQAKLEGTDVEKLYLMIKAEGTPEEKATRAKLWTRKDIKEELSEAKHGIHEHELDLSRTSAPCKVCGQWLKV